MYIYGVFDMNDGLYGCFLRDYPTLDEANVVCEICERSAESVGYNGDYRVLRFDGKTWQPVEG